MTVQRAIEGQGIPTILITVDVESSRLMRPPRAVNPKGFIWGHSVGVPNNPKMQTEVVMAALQHLVTPQEPGQIKEIEIAGYPA